MLQQLLLPFSSRDMNTHSIWSFVSLTGDTVTGHANINLTRERDYICARAQLHRKKKNWIFVTSLWVHEIILNFVLIKHFSHDEILHTKNKRNLFFLSPSPLFYSHSCMWVCSKRHRTSLRRCWLFAFVYDGPGAHTNAHEYATTSPSEGGTYVRIQTPALKESIHLTTTKRHLTFVSIYVCYLWRLFYYVLWIVNTAH